ncbi:hypothetical protein IWW54_005336 [Coemansia sp. RSA 2705]|nr:hypothetical protein IWW54_005336 [Coemansia sp. RSA 2705]
MKAVFAFGSALALFAGMANAHTYLSKMTIGGKLLNEGQCIRPYPVNRNYPVKDVQSTDLTCGFGGVSSTASETCPAEAGSTITVEWHHDNDSASDDIIDVSHLGPCLVYMAPLESNGKGPVFFKIFEDGYDAATNTWCVNKIRANGGKLDVQLPSDIKAGDYLLRTEILALHESDTDYAVNPARGTQFYVNCAQITVTGGGSAEPKGYAIPGIYKSDAPGILFNLYSSYTSYPIPGPAVYVSGSGSKDNEGSVEDESTIDSVESSDAPAEESSDVPVEESSDAPAEESSGAPVAESSDNVASDYTESSTEESNAPEYSDSPAETSAEESPSSDAAQDSATELPTEDTATDASEVPTSSAPLVTYTTTTTAAPGKCH